MIDRGLQGGPEHDVIVGARFVNTSAYLLRPCHRAGLRRRAAGTLDEEDLVYLQPRPVRRSRIVVAAAAASFTAPWPIIVIPSPSLPPPPEAVGLSGWSAPRRPRSPSSPTPASSAPSASSPGAYSVWGLYIFIREGFAATAADSAARLAVRTYARSVLSGIADITRPAYRQCN